MLDLECWFRAQENTEGRRELRMLRVVNGALTVVRTKAVFPQTYITRPFLASGSGPAFPSRQEPLRACEEM